MKILFQMGGIFTHIINEKNQQMILSKTLFPKHIFDMMVSIQFLKIKTPDIDRKYKLK